MSPGTNSPAESPHSGSLRTMKSSLSDKADVSSSSGTNISPTVSQSEYAGSSRQITTFLTEAGCIQVETTPLAFPLSDSTRTLARPSGLQLQLGPVYEWHIDRLLYHAAASVKLSESVDFRQYQLDEFQEILNHLQPIDITVFLGGYSAANGDDLGYLIAFRAISADFEFLLPHLCALFKKLEGGAVENLRKMTKEDMREQRDHPETSWVHSQGNERVFFRHLYLAIERGMRPDSDARRAASRLVSRSAGRAVTGSNGSSSSNRVLSAGEGATCMSNNTRQFEQVSGVANDRVSTDPCNYFANDPLLRSVHSFAGIGSKNNEQRPVSQNRSEQYIGLLKVNPFIGYPDPMGDTDDIFLATAQRAASDTSEFHNSGTSPRSSSVCFPEDMDDEFLATARRANSGISMIRGSSAASSGYDIADCGGDMAGRPGPALNRYTDTAGTAIGGFSGTIEYARPGGHSRGDGSSAGSGFGSTSGGNYGVGVDFAGRDFGHGYEIATADVGDASRGIDLNFLEKRDNDDDGYPRCSELVKHSSEYHKEENHVKNFDGAGLESQDVNMEGTAGGEFCADSGHSE